MRQAGRLSDRNAGTFSAYQFQGPEVRRLYSENRQTSFRFLASWLRAARSGALEEWLR